MNLEMWKDLAKRDPEVCAELNALSDEQLHESFYKELEFGTAGMRGLLGVGPNRMNEYTVGKANLGFARYLVETFANNPIKVAIAYDNRHKSKEFAQVCANILSSMGIETFVFKSLRPTPELSFAVRELKCSGGIVITASHNPKEYNGYKIYDETGCQLVDHKVSKVIENISKLGSETAVDIVSSNPEKIHFIDESFDNIYLDKIKTLQLRHDSDKIVKIVFSSQHGTAYPLVPQLLKSCGYDVIVVEEQASHDPNFSNTLTPNPEDKASYELAIEYAKKYNADLILSCDPDADRMGIVVRHNNDFHYLTGNQGGSILQEYLYSSLQEKFILPTDAMMFNTIVTSDLGEKIANKYGVRVEKTLTGFKYIGDKIEKHNQLKDATFVFGYEESYGYLIGDFVRDKDALQACLMVAEAANYYLSQNMTLVDVLGGLYKEFGAHVEEQLSITKSGSEGLKEIQNILDIFRNYKQTSIGNIEIVKVDDYLRGYDSLGNVLNFPKSNVLKFYLEDGSWIAIRPSGTEPKCKFYFCVVDKNLDLAHSKYAKLLDEIRNIAKI